MIEVDKTLKSFFESDVFTSLNEPQKLSVASVMHAMYEAMQRETDKRKTRARPTLATSLDARCVTRATDYESHP